MIQDVKLGTHKIGTYMYVIKKCAFLLGFYLEMPLRSDEHCKVSRAWTWGLLLKIITESIP